MEPIGRSCANVVYGSGDNKELNSSYTQDFTEIFQEALRAQLSTLVDWFSENRGHSQALAVAFCYQNKLFSP